MYFNKLEQDTIFTGLVTELNRLNETGQPNHGIVISYRESFVALMEKIAKSLDDGWSDHYSKTAKEFRDILEHDKAEHRKIIEAQLDEPSRTSQESINAGLAFSKSLGY